jgi:predicted DNA-binding transcriptional regulator YafY
VIDLTERLIRLIRIIILIQGKPGILARELAERCETTERTIYRDLELLSVMIPITNLGHGKGYTFVGNFSMYPMNWTEQESLAFSMLPSVIDQIKSLLPSGFDSAYEKIMATNNKEKRKNTELVQNIAQIIQLGTPANREEEQANFLFPIIQAILSQKTIKTLYHTQSRNESTVREIDPYYLIPRDHRFYLIGFCHTAQDIRTFRISRFKDVEVLEQNYDKGVFNIRQYLKHTWSIERGEENIHFKIKFSPNVARYVLEEELFVSPKMTNLRDGSMIFEVTLDQDREFLGWLSQYGPDAEILEPVSYRQAMQERLSSWMEIYKK